MGNWRRVQIVGTCEEEDIEILRKAITWDQKSLENFHCLMFTGGVAGLPDWARDRIKVVGNLAERDYDMDDVVEALKDLHKIVPSLNVRVHCGGENEDEKCVATVELMKNQVTILTPQIKEIPEISANQMNSNLMGQLSQ